MEGGSDGEYIVLVVRVQEDAKGVWHLHVDGANGTMDIPLMPLDLVVRLWRSHQSGILRGTIRLQNGPLSAPFQSNAQLEQLIHTWLSGNNPAA